MAKKRLTEKEKAYQEWLKEWLKKEDEKAEGKKGREIRKIAKSLGVSTKYLRDQQHWIQEGRAPTEAEFTAWARNQHKCSCRTYQAAYPLLYYKGKCVNCLNFKRPCLNFFSHSGICETGYFVPERISISTWNDFQKSFRKARRKVRLIIT